MSLDGLSLEAQQALDNYLFYLSNRLHCALVEVRDSVVSTVESRVQARLQESSGNLQEVKSILNSLGDPEVHATRVANWLWLSYLQQESVSGTPINYGRDNFEKHTDGYRYPPDQHSD